MTRTYQPTPPEGPVSPASIRRHVVWTSAITALGGLLFGYDTGVISGALLFIGKDFRGLTSFDKELLTSLLLVGAMIGALVAGRVADRLGRRPTVLGTAALFVVSTTTIAALTGYSGSLGDIINNEASYHLPGVLGIVASAFKGRLQKAGQLLLEKK